MVLSQVCDAFRLVTPCKARRGTSFHHISQRYRYRLQLLLDGGQDKERRASYRVSVNLPAWVEWQEPVRPFSMVSYPTVVTDLSGGGAEIFLRHLPPDDTFHLTMEPIEAFVEEWALRQLSRRGLSLCSAAFLFQQTCEKVRHQFKNIKTRIVTMDTRREDLPDSIYALSVAFMQPHEGCFRLVRYLEVEALSGRPRLLSC